MHRSSTRPLAPAPSPHPASRPRPLRRRRSTLSARCAPALLGLLALGACSGPGRTLRPEWQAGVVWTAPAKLGGCAVGDLSKATPGDEIVAVSITGEIHRLRRGEDGWDHRVLADTPGELIQVAIGDADPTRPGNEVLAVGMRAGTEEDGGPGMAWLVTDCDGPAPTLVPLLEDSALLHAGTIADVDPDHPGDEVVVAGFSLDVHVLAHDGAGFLQTRAGTLPGPAKHALGWRGGVAIACASGELVLLEKVDGAWSLRTLATAPAGLARLGGDSEVLVVARDDGVLWEVGPDGSHRELYREGEKLRGAALADLDPDRPGREFASAGYEGRIVVHAHDAAGELLSAVVWSEDARFHHLTVGEADPFGLGSELVACGYSGNVVLVRRTKVRD